MGYDTGLIPARGAAASLSVEVVRELTPGDLLLLHGHKDEQNANVPLVKKLTARHHRQAELIAQGRKLAEVAAIVGSTPQRLYQLMRDPSFTDLVAYYQDQTLTVHLEAGARIRDKLIIAGEEAVDEIVERMESEVVRKQMPIGELRQIAQLTLDRTVAPPKVSQPVNTTPTNITLSFGRELGPKDITPPTGNTSINTTVIEHKKDEGEKE